MCVCDACYLRVSGAHRFGEGACRVVAGVALYCAALTQRRGCACGATWTVTVLDVPVTCCCRGTYLLVCRSPVLCGDLPRAVMLWQIHIFGTLRLQADAYV